MEKSQDSEKKANSLSIGGSVGGHVAQDNSSAEGDVNNAVTGKSTSKPWYVGALEAFLRLFGMGGK